MDRFVLSEMAIHQPEDFAGIVALAKEALATEAATGAQARIEA
jgi:hypothetical protein